MQLLRFVPVVISLLFVAPAEAWAAEPVWVWPLAGQPEVSRPFDPPEVRYAAGHRGADLASAPGAEVVAAGPGRVGYAGLLAGRGVVVVVHGDLRTTYEPVVAEVAVGDAVAAGQRLGALAPGHEGCPVAACLHWGLRRGETYLDPVQLVQRGPVRLLPPGARTVGAGAGVGPVGAEPASAGATPPDRAPTSVSAPARSPDGTSEGTGGAAPSAAVVAAAAAGASALARRPGRHR